MSTVNSANGVSDIHAATNKKKPTSSDMESRFLKLLTTQLQNQDPMSPMQNAEMTSQLAQMSTVDGIERLNKMVQELIQAQSDSGALQAAALVGHGVLVPGTIMGLTEKGGVGGFELPDGADTVIVTIKDSTGAEVTSLTFDNLDPGSHNFVWDGGVGGGGEEAEKAAPGIYTMSITAISGGESAEVKPLTFGLVTGVIKGPQGADLQIGDLGVFKLSDIRQIL